MHIKSEQLASHINLETPFYLLTGDETLLRMEAEQQLRETLLIQGVTERQSFIVDGAGFDWQVVMAEIAAPSLFADKRLIELRGSLTKMNAKAAAAMKEYLENPQIDVIVMLSVPRLEKSETKKAWYKLAEDVGVIVPFWPLSMRDMPAYLGQKLKREGFEFEPAAMQVLAEQYEGNLLGANQELEKLKLLFETQKITPEKVAKSIVGGAKFTIFDLGEAVLSGDKDKVVTVLRTLNQEGAEPVLMTWSMTRELKILAELSTGKATILRDYRIPQNKHSLYHKAVGRYSARGWMRLYALSTRLDKVAKGLEYANFWMTLENICLGACGKFATRP